MHLTWLMVIGVLIGGGFGAVAARRVKMTAMPQMVALFNGVGGGAAALDRARGVPQARAPLRASSPATSRSRSSSRR